MIDELFEKILELSEQKKINWEKNVMSENSFKAQLKDFTIYIIPSAGDFFFIIINGNGDEIGRLSSSDYVFDSKFREMCDLARRRALKIDESFNEINSLLDSL